jgi:hypothetical protein
LLMLLFLLLLLFVWVVILLLLIYKTSILLLVGAMYIGKDRSEMGICSEEPRRAEDMESWHEYMNKVVQEHSPSASCNMPTIL